MCVIFAYLYLFSCSFLFSTMNCCHCAGVLGVSLFETLVLSLVYFFIQNLYPPRTWGVVGWSEGAG